LHRQTPSSIFAPVNRTEKTFLMNHRRILHVLPFLLFPYISSFAQCGSCDYTEANLAGGTTPIDNIPAGKILCITNNYCLGASANWPGPTCGNINTGHLIINGTLRICSSITFSFDGTIAGSGNIEIMAGGRMSLFGTYDCNVHMTAVDQTLLSGGTSTSTTIGGCASSACEPHFSNGYAPFGVIGGALGYTVNNGSCAITGKTDLLVLPVELLNWTISRKGQNMLLTWSAPGDDQGSSYEIDYSTDGQSWSALSQIPGSNGETINWYSYLAKGPFREKNFFRIRHTTAAGLASYSPVKEIDADDAGNMGFFVGPNPVQNSLMIRPENGDTRFYLQLFDMTGKKVWQANSSVNGQYAVERLGPGVYILILTQTDGTHVVKKITKL